MATSAGVDQDQYALSIRYGDKNKPFYFSGNELVRDVVKKAASDLRISFDDREKLVLAHMGYELPGRATLKDVLKSNRSTCCFLLLSHKDVHSSFTQSQIDDLNNREDVGKCYGFCTHCNSVVQIRPRFTCSLCKKDNFTLEKAVNFFEDDHSRIVGSCHSCGVKGKPLILHDCVAKISDPPHHAVFLLHLRQNILELPCMKCEDKQDIIFKFHCNHTMCMNCFSNMCSMLLEVGAFTLQDPVIGYSLGCPGGGPHCSSSLVTDPHHFYLVDGKKKFYESYKEKSWKVYVDQSIAPKCQKCDNPLDTTRAEEAEVESAQKNGGVKMEVPLETGGVWLTFIKKFQKTKISSETVTQEPKKTTRQQIKCGRCQSLYCGICLSIWHEGDCIKMTEDQKRATTQFQVDRKKAAASEWR